MATTTFVPGRRRRRKRCVEWKAISVTAAEFYSAVIPSNLFCKFGFCSFIKHTP